MALKEVKDLTIQEFYNLTKCGNISCEKCIYDKYDSCSKEADITYFLETLLGEHEVIEVTEVEEDE